MQESNIIQDDKLLPRVLCWAKIKPNKQGSFEDYLWRMTVEAKKRKCLFVLCVLGPVDSKFIKDLKDIGCEIVFLNENKIRYPWRLIKLLHHYKINILHTHFVGPADIFLLIIRFFWSGKIVFTDHSSNPLLHSSTSISLKTKIQNAKRFVLSFFIDLYLPVSNFVEKRICKNVPMAQHKIHRLYNGIDLKRFKPYDNVADKKCILSDLSIRDDELVVSFIGQLTTEKGIHLCLNVIDKLLKNHTKFHFLIVGDGNKKTLVSDFYSNNTDKKYIHILGSRSDVDDILRVTDVLLVPSLWGEAFGLTAAEGIATAVPVIASNIGGITEIVKNNYNGLLIKVDCEKELEKSIKYLLDSPDVRSRMGMNGRSHAVENFSLDLMINKTYKYYKDLLLLSSCKKSYKFFNNKKST